MSYRITTLAGDGHTAYGEDARIVIVGCGGTGSFLAEAVCRLLIGRRASLFLVDMDRVEPHNVARQAFDDSDVGRFKAEVLARRLSRRFRREVGYSVLPYDPQVHGEVFGGSALARLSLLVGCVDDAHARQAIARTLQDHPVGHWHRQSVWWLDCGNERGSGQVLLGNATEPDDLRGAFAPDLGLCRALPAPSLQRPDLLLTPPEPEPRVDCGNERDSGQVLLGNATKPDDLRGAFAPDLGLCRALPAPSLQRPDLLVAPPEPEPRLDCAERVARGDQGPTINQVVAAVAATYVERLLEGTCSWLGTYFDLDAGTLRTVYAEPKAVASMVGLHVNAVAPSGGRPRKEAA